MADTMRKYSAVSLDSVDYMPASLPLIVPNTHLIMCEDNDAVIKMLREGRAPAMSHIARTHRVNLDWLLERSFDEPNVYCHYEDTKQQLADLLTKQNFMSAD